jgi:ABC-type antimicrobial peptide transport system permease subunit
MWGTVTSNQLTWEGNDESQQLKISWESVSPEYIATMGLVLKEGRNFDRVIAADSGNVIVNENLAKLMGREGRVGASLLYLQRHRLRVIGIVKDFLFNNMYDGATPLMLSCDPETSANYQSLRIRLNHHITVSAALAKIESVMKTQNPGYPFDYQFVDQEFDSLFRVETQVGELAAVFAGLAIIISCLGLFGLAAFTAEGRTKEIGVRKVLGASVGDLVVLLSGEFVQLVALSCLIAFPLAWAMMHSWLSDYAYRTPIYWWVFGGAGLAAMIIALLTVSYQAVSAALLNPVKTLRIE